MQITRNQFCKIMLLLESVSRSDSLRAQWRDAPLPKHPRRTHRLGRERGGCCPQRRPPLLFCGSRETSHDRFDEMRARLGDRTFERGLKRVDVGCARRLDAEAFGDRREIHRRMIEREQGA
jgi:hypothetical protein